MKLNTIFLGLIAAAGISLSGPVSANTKPVSPGPGWILSYGWCAGPSPQPVVCPAGRSGQHWMWIKPLPRRGSRGAYQIEVTYPSWNSSKYDPITDVVDCNLWQKWDASKNLWSPIFPNTNGEYNAEVACGVSQ